MQCIDVQGDKAVLGSHDHALYTIDLNRGEAPYGCSRQRLSPFFYDLTSTC